MQLRRLASLAALVLAPHASAQFQASLITDGLPSPTSVTYPPGDANRLFVTCMRNGVFVVDSGVLQPTMFLNLNAIHPLASQGLMSLAFHPDYANNGRFFVAFMDELERTHVMEFSVSQADPNLADPASGLQILGPFQQPSPIHNWNLLKFGSDGYLYLSTGDGLLSSDNSANNGQDLGTLLGKMLRIDVDSAAPYAIPPDNPYVGVAGALEEIYHVGLRQPWKYDWDPLTDDLWVCDVGNGMREEISFYPATSPAPANFGWKCFEGTNCTNFTGCNACVTTGLVTPTYEFPHTEGRCAIIGGMMYRGTQVPELQSKFIFADHCSARFWALEWNGTSTIGFEEITVPTDQPFSINLPSEITRDINGEALILDRGFGNNGALWRIEPGSPCGAMSYCISGSNSIAASGCSLSASGSTNISDNNFQLTAIDVPTGQPGLFFYGPDQALAAFGDGFRCVGGQIFRLNPPVAANPNTATRLLDFSNLPVNGDILPGSTWRFQFWYRDPVFGGQGFNLSDAIAANFCP